MENDDSGQQAEIRHLLRQQATPKIPSDVGERIQQALRSEQDQRDTAPKRRWLLPLGAAAALALLAGVIFIPGGSEPEPQPVAADCSRPISAEGDLSAVTAQTGRTYSEADFAVQAQQLVNESSSCPSSTTTTTNAELQTGGPTSSGVTQATDCLVAVIPQQRVLAVDMATYEGQEVLVAVTAAEPPQALAVDCNRAKVMVSTPLQ
ncbi:MAG: hypothetical protein CMH41_10185 [Micrococcales bacterium]|nr:hypothetical protein [Micrococcales bacterium]